MFCTWTRISSQRPQRRAGEISMQSLRPPRLFPAGGDGKSLAECISRSVAARMQLVAQHRPVHRRDAQHHCKVGKKSAAARPGVAPTTAEKSAMQTLGSVGTRWNVDVCGSQEVKGVVLVCRWARQSACRRLVFLAAEALWCSRGSGRCCHVATFVICVTLLTSVVFIRRFLRSLLTASVRPVYAWFRPLITGVPCSCAPPVLASVVLVYYTHFQLFNSYYEVF